MIRLDKVISSQTSYSRNEIKQLIRKKKITINDKIVLKSDVKVDTSLDIIKINNEILEIKEFVYLILNKPKGYVSASKDNTDKTVLDLVPEKYKHRNLFPAGRLDKDTTGLMLITDDGVFAHEILSPKKHVKKTYEVIIDIPITDAMIKGFKDGVILNDGICKTASLEKIDIPMTKEMIEGFKKGISLNDGECKPSILEINDTYTGRVILNEGRYHQIKRMFGCFGAKVVELHRVAMGNLNLPKDLDEGQCRELTEEELKLLQQQL